MKLDLYVMDHSARSNRAVKNLKALAGRLPEGSCTYTVHDFFEHPQLTREHNLVVSPILIRREPLPEKRLLGDLSNLDDVIRFVEADVAFA